MLEELIVCYVAVMNRKKRTWNGVAKYRYSINASLQSNMNIISGELDIK